MSIHADSMDAPVEAHDQVAADEPRTPAWVTLLGVVLFLVAIILFVATRPPGKTGEELARQAQAAAQARAAAQKAAEPPPSNPAAAAPAQAQPGQEAMPKKGG